MGAEVGQYVMSGAQRARICHCSWEASPLFISSVLYLLSIQGVGISLLFQVVLQKLTLLELGAGTSCDCEYQSRNNIVLLGIII